VEPTAVLKFSLISAKVDQAQNLTAAIAHHAVGSKIGCMMGEEMVLDPWV